MTKKIGSWPVIGHARSALAIVALLLTAAVLAGCAESVARRAAPQPQPVAAEVAVRQTPAARAAPLAKVPDWHWWFDDISKGGILIDIEDRWLIYWEPGGGQYRAYPIAVPLNEDLERTGKTKVVRKRENPDWRPTPSMIERNPELPRYIGPGPQNPLGEHAMYLGWQYYAIHGTNDPRAIGTRATSGCFRLHPDDIEELYYKVEIGTPVVVMRDVKT